MKKITFTEREKLLIYILSLTLLIFLYINFIRDSKLNEVNAYSDKININQYNEMIELKNSIITKIESSEYIKESLVNRHKNFGQRVNTEDLIEDLDLTIKNFSISQVQRESIEDIEVFSITSNTNLEGTKEGIIEYLRKIKEIEFLHIKDLSITRIDKLNHSLEISLKEYTLLDLPSSGVVRRNNYTTDEIKDDSSLLDNLYGNSEEDKESLKEEREESNSIASKPAVSTVNKSSSKSKEKDSSEVSNEKKNSEVLLEEKLEDKDTTIKAKEDEVYLNFSVIDNKKPITIGESYLRDYVEQWDVNFIFDTSYFTKWDIEEQLKFQERISIDERSGEVLLKINGLLDLKNCKPIIAKPKDLFAFEFDTDLGSRILLDFQDSLGDIYSVEAVKQYEDWQNVEFGLPIDSELYPLEIVSIRFLNKIGECNGQIKNFVFLSKK